MTFFLIIAFFTNLCIFGWQIARFTLRENKIEHLLALTPVLGIGLYIFFVNILGYFIPIQQTFILVSVVFFILSLQLINYRGQQLEWCLDLKWRKILLASALFITISVGVISFRQPMDVFTLREPTAATIAAGIFPPREIWSPSNLLFYHYAPDLFSAAVTHVTGASLPLGYDFQIALMTGSLFLLCFGIVHLFFQNAFIAFWSATYALYTGSLVFLKGLSGIPILFNMYIFHKEVTAPFKFITDAIGTDFGLPTFYYTIGVYWGAMAFALLLAILYIYFHILKTPDTEKRIPPIILAGILLALLALVAETFFAIICTVLFLFPFILRLSKKYSGEVSKIFITTFFILAIASPIALIQGGVLKSTIYHQFNLSEADSVEAPTMLYAESNSEAPIRLSSPFVFDGASIFTKNFLEKWILIILTLPFALVFLLRQRYELAIFLITSIFIFFITALIFKSDSPLIQQNFGRFFYPVNVFAGMALGIWVSSTYRTNTSVQKKWFLALLTFILLAQGVWTHAVWFTLGYPPGQKFNTDAAYFVQEGTFEASAYTWVKEHTSIEDTFLIIQDEYSDCGSSGAPNCLFIFNTGRMAPTFRFHQTTDLFDTQSAQKIALFDSLKNTCDENIIKKLDFDYLYVTERWSPKMEVTCQNNNNLKLVFEKTDGEKFVRILKVQ